MRYRALDANGDYSFGLGPQEYLANSPQTVAQAVLTALLLHQGEWFLDITAGMPWETQVLGFGTGSLYDAAIKNAILGVEGVASIVSYSSALGVAPVGNPAFPIVQNVPDSFHRPNQNPINTNWKSFRLFAGSSFFVLGQVLNNQYIGQDGSATDMYYDSGSPWAPNQSSQARLLTLNEHKGYAGLYVRASVSGGYQFLLDGVFANQGLGLPTGAKLSGPSGLLQEVVITPQQFDVFTLSAIGSQISVKQNQTTILNANDILATSGNPGIFASPLAGVAADVAWDNWIGTGEIVAGSGAGVNTKRVLNVAVTIDTIFGVTSLSASIPTGLRGYGIGPFAEIPYGLGG